MPQPEGHLPQVVKKKEGHMPELRKRRTHLALLGAFAMVASVLAAGTSPVSARPGNAEAKAAYSACVGPATVDAGFTDVATGSTHDAAINCIAYYGITRGTTATTFAPERSISRWQLAVMLKRAAGPAGADLVAPRNQGYTDISGLSSSFQDAVNQMAADGIMRGTSATTFSPDDPVTRAVIVEALAGFLTKARVGPGGRALSRDVNGTATVKDGVAANANLITVDETFRDIGGVTFSENSAIRALAEMDVVAGRGDGTFGPAALVTRAQAASFITRALAHTNARPAGLNLQVNKAMVATGGEVDLSISLRSNDFAPLDEKYLDVFSHTVKNAGSAFNADGTCVDARVRAVQSGASACRIELTDQQTEDDGNLLLSGNNVPEATTWWAWTGDTGDRLDWDDSNLSRENSDVSNAASVTVTNTLAAAEAKVSLSVSPDAEGGNTVRYGTTVTVTIQLVDSKSQPIGIAGQQYQWHATGIHNPSVGRGIIAGTGTRAITTDADGRASFTLTQADPKLPMNANDATANDLTTWTYNIAPGTNGTALSTNNAIGFSSGSGTVVFDDDGSKANKVSATVQRMFTVVAATAPAGTKYPVSVEGKVTDQYGNAMRGATLFFDLDGDDQFGCDVLPACSSANTAVTMDTRGRDTIVGVDYALPSNSRGTRRADAEYIVGSTTPRRSQYLVAADLNDDDDVDDADEQATVWHYWAASPTGYDAETGSGDADPNNGLRIGSQVMGVDLATNTILRLARDIDNTPDDVTDDTIEPEFVRAYSYTDDTRFRLIDPQSLNADRVDAGWTGAAGEEWVNGVEFEGRWRRYMAWCELPANADTCGNQWLSTGDDVYVFTGNQFGPDDGGTPRTAANQELNSPQRTLMRVNSYNTSPGGLIVYWINFNSGVNTLFAPAP